MRGRVIDLVLQLNKAAAAAMISTELLPTTRAVQPAVGLGVVISRLHPSVMVRKQPLREGAAVLLLGTMQWYGSYYTKPGLKDAWLID